MNASLTARLRCELQTFAPATFPHRSHWPSAAVTQTNCFNPSFGRWRLNTRHEKPQTRTPRGSALHLFLKPSTFEIADLTKRNSAEGAGLLQVSSAFSGLFYHSHPGVFRNSERTIARGGLINAARAGNWHERGPCPLQELTGPLLLLIPLLFISWSSRFPRTQPEFRALKLFLQH